MAFKLEINPQVVAWIQGLIVYVLRSFVLHQFNAGFRRPDQPLKLLLTMTELAQALLRTLISIRLPKSLDGVEEWAMRASTLVQALRRR